MKKILAIISAVMALVAVTACSDDDTVNPYAQASSITVDSVRILFQAAPSTGVIHVSAPNGISRVTSAAEWCAATVSGSSVVVNVEQNDGLESRASQVTIYSGKDSTQVTVQQMGFIFQISAGSQLKVNDDAQTVSYDVKYNADIQVWSDVDWAEASLSGNKLNVSIKANDSGHLRNTYIYYQGGDIRDSIRVVQVDFDKDIAGNYRFVGYNGSKWTYTLATLTADKLDFTSLGFTLPVTFDPNTISVSFKCGQLMGTYSSYYIYSSIWDTNAGYLTYSDKYGMVAPFTYSEEDGTIAEFVDDGTWGTYTATAMRWEKFKAESPITANRVGYLLYWMYPYLQKIEE